MKYVIIIGDGMADYPVDTLGGETPLQAAETPAMDFLAKHGAGGLTVTIPDCMHPGSDVANMSIMGYDTGKQFTGRGYFEARAKGIELEDDETSFRMNTIYASDGILENYSAGHISSEEAECLVEIFANSLKDMPVRLYHGVSYRHLLILKGNFTELRTFPPHDIMGEKIEAHLPSGPGQEIIREIMVRSTNVIADTEVNHERIKKGLVPANMVWLWGPGKKLDLPTIPGKFGVSGGVISAVDLIKGIGIMAGLKPIPVEGITGYLDTNFEGKAKRALEALEDMDLVYIHVEAPDEASHEGNLKAKIKAIEDVDSKVVNRIYEGLKNKSSRILVLPDHRTPLSLRTHSAEPVPFALWGEGISPDNIESFSEKSAEKGKYYNIEGHSLINHLIGTQ